MVGSWQTSIGNLEQEGGNGMMPWREAMFFKQIRREMVEKLLTLRF